MRIAQVAPLYEPVPPRYYGGTERVVGEVTEELVRRGHRVVLFASGDSTASAELVACCPRGLRGDPKVRDALAYNMIQLEMLGRRAREFDIIHNHIDYLAFPVSRFLPAPMITTLHGRLDRPDLQPLYAHYPEVGLVSISRAQRRPLPKARWLATVHNGVPLNHFTFRDRPGSYLAFLGRISPEKGVDRAIAIARAADMPLRIAAKVDQADQEYFTEKIKPLLRGPGVEYLGEIDETQKDDFLGNAFANIFPITWPEPFGITMIEAMACGTPVIATNLGSVPELVIHGRTGFICRSVVQMVDAVEKVPRLSRRDCRTHVEKTFSTTAMADAYEALYRASLTKTLDYAGAGHRRRANKARGRVARVVARIQRDSSVAQSVGARAGEDIVERVS